jgi:hypothetical protein
MFGFAVEAIRRLAEACTGNRPIVWVHDFFTLCPNPFLLRNDVTFCNAPLPESGACLVCCYGAERQRHLTELSALFEELQPFILSPSEAALDFWNSRGSLAHVGSQVTPHAFLTLKQSGARTSGKPDAPLRVAHLGAASVHKGWPVFEGLMERHANDPRYQFVRLGLGQADLPGLTEAPVEVTAANRNAMVDALRGHEIDVVVNWSKCYETFSFTALEAVAGGAYVLAREGAGNVWPAIAGTGRGRAVRTETELRALFITGEIRELAKGPKITGDIRLANGSADFVLNGGYLA